MKICAIILASGFSKRMGPNKLHLYIKGKKMYTYIINLIAETTFFKKIIITNDLEIQKYAEDRGYEVYKNPNAKEGKSSSIRIGVKNLPICDGIMFFPCDQPFLTKKTIYSIKEKFEIEQNKIIYPIYKVEPGSPVIIPYFYREQLLNLKEDEGGKKLITSMNSKSIFINNIEEGMDIDSFEDYKNLK